MYQTFETELPYTHPHNDYLELFSEFGLVGGIIWWIGILAVVISVAFRLKDRRYPFAVGIGLGCITAVMALLFHGLVSFNFQIPANAVLFCTLLATAYNVSYLQVRENGHIRVIPPVRRITLPASWRRPLALAAAALMMLLATWVILGYLGERRVRHLGETIRSEAGTAPRSWLTTESLAQLKKARAAAPGNAFPLDVQAGAYIEMALAQKDTNGRILFLELAAREYHAAINLQPTNAWYHAGLGWVYSALAERDAFLRIKAYEQFDIAKSLAPNNKKLQEYLRVARGS